MEQTNNCNVMSMFESIVVDLHSVHKWKLSVVSLMAYCFLMGPLSLLMRFRCHALHAAYGSAQGNILSSSCDQLIHLELRTIAKHKAEMLKNGTVTYSHSAVHVVWFWKPIIELFVAQIWYELVTTTRPLLEQRWAGKQTADMAVASLTPGLSVHDLIPCDILHH